MAVTGTFTARIATHGVDEAYRDHEHLSHHQTISPIISAFGNLPEEFSAYNSFLAIALEAVVHHAPIARGNHKTDKL